MSKQFVPKAGSLSCFSNVRGTRHLNKAVIHGYRGKSSQISRTFNAVSVHLDSGQMARTGKRTIVHCPRGIPRRSQRLREEFMAVFPQWTRSAYRLNSPTLGKDIYIEREQWN